MKFSYGEALLLHRRRLFILSDPNLEELGKLVDTMKRQFATGSQRDNRDGKGRFDLLPPRAMLLLAKLFEKGAENYGDRNWEKGQDLGSYFDSGLRHVFEYMAGHTNEDHLVSAAWNFMAAIETRERIREGILGSDLENIPPTQP